MFDLTLICSWHFHSEPSKQNYWLCFLFTATMFRGSTFHHWFLCMNRGPFFLESPNTALQFSLNVKHVFISEVQSLCVDLCSPSWHIKTQTCSVFICQPVLSRCRWVSVSQNLFCLETVCSLLTWCPSCIVAKWIVWAASLTNTFAFKNVRIKHLMTKRFIHSWKFPNSRNFVSFYL